MVLAAIVFVRIFTLGMVDLIDPTETRYAFVAQEMILSGDWLTPKLPLPSGLEPYLGKPPLHFWLTAISMTVFGMDAWATRLPSVIAWIAIGLTCYLFAIRFFNWRIAAIASIVQLSGGLIYFLSASCTVDITLSAWVCGALAAFAFATVSDDKKKVSGYLFFLFSALAFLTKGPVGLVIIGAPLFFWLFAKDSRRTFPRLPWIGGTVLFLLIATPWFLACERANPGFLRYFFVQENFLRFISKDYGDRFGTGHVYPRGSAIWMALVGLLPWSAIYVGMLATSKGARKLILSPDLWTRYCLSWLIAPVLFFCFARQLHAAYMIPAFLGFSIIFAVALERVALPKMPELFTRLTQATILLAVGTFPAAIFFSLDATHATLAITAALPSLYLFRKTPPRGELLTEILRFSLALVALYGVTTALFARHAGRIKSSREILTVVAPQLESPDATVGFFSVNAYSFYYYPRDWEVQLGAPIQPKLISVEDLITHPPAHLILNKNDIGRIPAESAQKYQEALSFGKWRWWKLK